MRIVCLSDTHEQHERIAVPDGDVLVHAGDATYHGVPQAIDDAFAWLSSMPHERIVFVPGNHDFAFQQTPKIVEALARAFPRVEILCDAATTFGDHRVWGSPWQPWFHDWAYNFAAGAAGEEQAVEKWAEIPDDTAILITHGPVRGILDRTVRGAHVGCPALGARIARLDRLRLHVCGHIHEAYGEMTIGNVRYVNASSCDVGYEPTQAPIVVDL